MIMEYGTHLKSVNEREKKTLNKALSLKKKKTVQKCDVLWFKEFEPLIHNSYSLNATTIRAENQIMPWVQTLNHASLCKVRHYSKRYLMMACENLKKKKYYHN